MKLVIWMLRCTERTRPLWFTWNPRVLFSSRLAIFDSFEIWLTRICCKHSLSPFNFPFDLTVGPLIEMLASGNRVIIKPSEYTPKCGQLLKSMINSTFPKDLVEVILGAADVAKEATSMPFDHILYTGTIRFKDFRPASHRRFANIILHKSESGQANDNILQSRFARCW